MTEPRQPFRDPLAPDFGEAAGRNDVAGLADLFRNPLDPGYADAARRKAAQSGDGQPARPGWRRPMRAGTLVALVVVGLLLAVAYRQVVAEEPTRSQVRDDLETQIHQRQAETEQLRQQAEQLRDEVAQLRDRQISDPKVVQRLRQLEASTGLSRVSGDGVVVQVADGPPGVDPKTGEPVLDPQARILYRDLQQVANALWAAGAEAVAVNDRRLTATSTIRSASDAILVDRQPVTGPYEVAAIGPDHLRDRFTASPTASLMKLLMDEYGITYEVRDADDLSLPAASQPQLHHATSAGGE